MGFRFPKIVCIIPCSRAVTKISNCARIYARIIISKRWIKQVEFSFSSIFPMFLMIVMACGVPLVTALMQPSMQIYCGFT